MNLVILMGRTTRDVTVRYTQGEKPTTIASTSIAVDRDFKRDEADFINITAFGKTAEFMEKYVPKGTKILVRGRWHSDSYMDNNINRKVYTSDCIVDKVEFAQSKTEQSPTNSMPPSQPAGDDGFMNIPDGIDEELPFN